MGKFVDITGQKFGKLTVLGKSDKKGKNRTTYWLCKCECGNEIIVAKDHLMRGVTTSCDCTREHHGHTNTKLYEIWSNMKQRCYNPKQTKYPYYGGRGITVCDEWRNSFTAFENWALNNGYKERLSIDRKDNDKGYSPDNCRWVTLAFQKKNRRYCKNL